MKRTARILGEKSAVELKMNGIAVEALVEGRAYTLEVREIRRGLYWFNWNGRSIEVAVSDSPDGYLALVGDRPVTVELLDSRQALRRRLQASQEGVVTVRAPMPGKIVRVLCRESSEVHANQSMVVIEAMKMQNEVRSPKSGVVRSVLVQEGSAVNAGDPIALVE